MTNNVIKAPQFRGHREMVAGMSSSFELALRFNEWAEKMGPRLTPAAIQKNYGCSCATSYRWFNAYMAAKARFAVREAA